MLAWVLWVPGNLQIFQQGYKKPNEFKEGKSHFSRLSELQSSERDKWADLLTGFTVKIPNEPLHSITQISFLPSSTAEGAETNQQLISLLIFLKLKNMQIFCTKFSLFFSILFNGDQTKRENLGSGESP